jgi:chloramphenicol O-acetyltransferase
MKKLPNLKSFILNTVLQREDSTVFDNTLSFVLKKYRNLQELNLRINSSTFDIVHCIESIFRTLAESDHHLSNLSVDWNPDRPTFYGKNYTFKKIFTSYPNSYLTSINIHLNGYKYATEDNVISVTSNCFPNARKIILNEVNICSSK